MNRVILQASEGYYYTNGETYVKTVEIPLEADATIWYKITDAEYQEYQEMLMADAENME